MKRIGSFLVITLGLFSAGTPAHAKKQVDPCGLTRKIRFADDVGNASLNDVFAKAQSISERNKSIRNAFKSGQCSLMKLAKTKTWKGTIKALHTATTNKAEIKSTAKKINRDLPKMGDINKLAADANALAAKLASLSDIAPKAAHLAAYQKNVKALARAVKQSVAFQTKVPKMKTKMNKLIAKHSQ